MQQPKRVELKNQKQFRIIPSVFPAINFFEDLVDPSEMEILWEIESITNDRLRQETGDIFLVPPADRISGPGSSVVMAAFTHIGKSSRFTAGSYGVYYAGLSPETAMRESIFHREQFLRATQEVAGEIMMREYEGNIVQGLHDIRSKEFNKYHDPDNYTASQQFGKNLRNLESWGLIYNSVRHQKNYCIAIFRPPALSIPQPVAHLRYVWNGERIIAVLNTNSVLQL